MAIQALVQDDANAPLVAPRIVRLASYNFRSHVLACPHDTER